MIIRVQILNVTLPAIFDDPGGVFVDLGETDMSLKKVAEELNEVNEIQYGGVRVFSVPDTAKNLIIFQQFIAPAPTDFDYTPLECRIYVGTNILNETWIGASRSAEGEGRLELTATKQSDYWIIGAKALRLPQIPYDDVEFTQANIETNWSSNYRYADGDLGIHFTPMYFGHPYVDGEMTIEYMRWNYHLLRIIREGFRTFGWCFKCEALESDEGRQLAAYLIDPNAYSTEALIEGNKALAESGEFELSKQFNISSGGLFGGLFGGAQKLYGYHVVKTTNTIIHDPGSNVIGGRYYGFGLFHFKVTIQYIPIELKSEVVRIEWFRNNPFTTPPSNTKVFEEEFRPSDDFVGDPTALFEKTFEADIQLQTNQSITIGIYIESFFKKVKIKNVILNVTPIKVFPQRGETINPANYLRNDTLLELLKGWVHPIRGKIDVIPGEKTVEVFPNFEIDAFGETLTGYYRNTLVDVTPIQISESAVVESPVSKPNRFQLVRWKQSSDPWIKRMGLDKLTPLFSRTLDLGEQYVPDYTEYPNPYFEPTVSDWVYDFSKGDEKNVPVNLPILLDHIPGDSDHQVSTDIGPRILFLTEFRPQQWDTEAGTQTVKLGWEGGQITTWNHAYMRNPFLSAAVQTNLVFGDVLQEIENTLFVSFWRAWIYTNITGSKMNILAMIKGQHYFGWSFRDAYKIVIRGRHHIANLLSIDDFRPSAGISTPATFIPRGSAGVIADDDSPNPCDGYLYDLAVAPTGTTWNFAITTDNPDSGVIEWRYEGSVTWTAGTSLADPTGPFYVRYRLTAGDCSNGPVKYVDPCGNVPTVLIDFEQQEDGDVCTTGTLGGYIVDAVLSTTLEYDLDDAGAWAPYTLGTEICGTYTKICFRGDVEFDNSCDDYTIPETCFEIPPDTDCLLNTPAIIINHVGLDGFTFDIGGTYASEIGSWHFFYRRIGEDEVEAKRWTDQNPIVGTDFEVRLHVFWCDDCEPYCSPWTTVEEPAPLMALQAAPEWDFTKIPEDRKAEIRNLVELGNRRELARIHNELELSEHEYCCGADLKHVMKWFLWGRDNGKL